MFIDTAAANSKSKPPPQHYEDVPLITTNHKGGKYDDEEDSPSLEPFVGQAPPTYLEATTPGLGGNPWTGRPSADEGAHLLSFDEPGRTLADPLEGEYKGPTFTRRKSLREQCTRRRMIKWIAAILVLILIAIIVTAATNKGDKKKTVSPIPLPPLADESGKESVKEDPVKEYPIRWPSRCKSDYHTNSVKFDFGSPGDLDIQEAIHQVDGPYKRVSGWIHVTKAPKEQAAGTIQAKFAYAVSKSIDVNSIRYASTTTSLTVGEPAFADGKDGFQPGNACLGLSIVLYMAPGAKLENFKVSATHLGMQIHEGVDFSVTNSTSISLITGTLDAPPFSSRQTRLETISGSISGKYALMDLLSVKTTSGSVNINVQPMGAVEGGSDTALFLANSLSGSIRADFERKNIPDRDYQMSVDTKVGSVDGTFIHGSSTVIKSVAGFLTADILPFEAGAYNSTIETFTDSGQSRITLRNPYVNPGTTMSKMTTVHKSVSGAIDLTYPQEWEGRLQGNTLNGSLHLQGRDLELIRKGENVPGGSSVEARKGSDGSNGSNMSFSTISGAIEVKVG